MDRPCICDHSKASHHTRWFRNKQDNKDFEDTCYDCLDEHKKVFGRCLGYYKAMPNLEWLELKAQEKVS
jgi:hypothetical protein